MTLNDPLSNSMSKILNAEKAGKETCIIASSKIAKEVLNLMNKHHYIGQFKEIKARGSNLLEVSLLKNINKCGVIKPRFAVAKDGIEKYERRYLPAKDFGFLIISTNKGLITHEEAKLKNIGGKLIAYCY
ncbi:MAG: 30S ribosomal protein S8 [Candidatus Woesearchaeota archaeon]|jgi:small subunit ribosomal protein S8